MESLTAKMSCFIRAYHCKENFVHVFSDEFAEILLGDDYDRIRQSIADGLQFFLPGFNGTAEEGVRKTVATLLGPSVLGRSVFCDDCFTNERRIGCRQLLLLAAGYDTAALRLSDGEISAFEADYPHLLQDKRERLATKSLKTKATYVPCDLKEDGWPQVLIQNGFDTRKKTFTSMMGISYYLSERELHRIFEKLFQILCDGSAVCMDYPVDAPPCNDGITRKLAAGAGEAMCATYTDRFMEQMLSDCGFKIYELLNGKAMTNRYFALYNMANPEYPMHAPDDVHYLLAVRKR